jgi:hypothetical protein
LSLSSSTCGATAATTSSSPTLRNSTTFQDQEKRGKEWVLDQGHAKIRDCKMMAMTVIVIISSEHTHAKKPQVQGLQVLQIRSLIICKQKGNKLRRTSRILELSVYNHLWCNQDNQKS